MNTIHNFLVNKKVKKQQPFSKEALANFDDKHPLSYKEITITINKNDVHDFKNFLKSGNNEMFIEFISLVNAVNFVDKNLFKFRWHKAYTQNGEEYGFTIYDGKSDQIIFGWLYYFEKRSEYYLETPFGNDRIIGTENIKKEIDAR